MPVPRKDEKRNPFISRCVHELVHGEGKDPKAAVGECYGIWDEHKKKVLDNSSTGYKILQWMKGQKSSETMVQCEHCLEYFDYTKEKEAGMGYIKCPGCGRNIDQEGKGVKKELNEGGE